MKTKAQQSYDKMWRELENEIYNLAADRYHADLPELRLFSAVIVDAAKSRDYEYFESKDFAIHSLLLRLSAPFLYNSVKKGWNVTKTGKIWAVTPEQAEDW